MSLANPRWGAPRIHGELLKLGFELSQATVAKYMRGDGKPPSQTWRTFLENHARELVSADRSSEILVGEIRAASGKRVHGHPHEESKLRKDALSNRLHRAFPAR
jgi:hypothetical protein